MVVCSGSSEAATEGPSLPLRFAGQVLPFPVPVLPAAMTVAAPRPAPAALLLDLRGVLVEDGRALDGTVDSVAQARRHGLAIRFVTNTARRHHDDLLQELGELGFAPQSGELATAPPLAALSWLKREHRRPPGARASRGGSHWGWSRSSG